MKNNLPPNWSWVKLGDVCEVVRGGSPRPMGNPKYFNGNIPFIKISDITKDDSKFVSDSITKVNEAGVKKSRLLKKGSLILSNSGSVCIPKFLAVDACIHDGFVSFLNFIKETDLDFLYHHFNYIRPFIIQKHKQGITQVNLNTSIVSEFKLPLPPLPVQKKIVAKIEELFSELDNGIAQLKKAKAQIKIYRQAVLKFAFEGKLTQSAEGIEQSEIKKAAEPKIPYQSNSERLKVIQETDHLSVTQEAGNGLPERWKWVKLGEILKFIGSGVTPKGGRNVYQNDGIVFIRSQNVYPNKLFLNDVAYINEQIDEKMKRSRIKPNDVLLNITGASIGRAAFIPEIFHRANVNQHVCILRFNSNEISSKYISSYLNSPQGQSYINSIQIGATRQALNYSQINNFPIPLTSINQQHQIVSEIESRFSVADKLEQTIDESLKKAEALRQSILKQAFEGRLV